MKVKYILYTLFLTSILFVYSSCEDKDDDWSETKTNNHVNSWIYENMSFWYYWNDKMPAQKNLNANIDPESYFESLLYNRNTASGDRFSWIQNNYQELLDALKGITPRDIGFEYIRFTNADFYMVIYVKPSTNAANQGIKRGQYIIKVNGTEIKAGSNDPLTGADTYAITVYDPADDTTKDIKVNVEYNYAENPIHFYNTYTLAGGKKAGYVVYNQFTSDNGDNSSAYDRALVNIFDQFISEGVTDVILDLRYNLGGSIFTATRLASALVPDRDINNVFSKNKYNALVDVELRKEPDYDEYIYDRFVDNIPYGRGSKADIPALGSQIRNAGGKLYILTGHNTASASELIINGLYPYMGSDIILIGTTTYGKNVGSISIYDEKDEKNKWGMQPIVMQTFNANDQSDYMEGINPIDYNGYVYDEFANDDRLKPFGDTDEILLSAALAHITGGPMPTKKLSKAGTIVPKGSSLEYKTGAYKMFVDSKKFESLINKD